MDSSNKTTLGSLPVHPQSTQLKTATKKLISIILSGIVVILICFCLYTSISTSYASFALASRLQPCSARVETDVKYSDLGASKIGNNADIPIDYHMYITLWNIINCVSISSSFLLALFLAIGNKGLMEMMRMYIIYIGTVGAMIFISLEAGLIALAVLIFQTGEIINYGEETVLKLVFPKLDPIIGGMNQIYLFPSYNIAYCPLDSSIHNYWTPLLLIASTVLTFITFTLLAVLVYLKVSVIERTDAVPSVEDGHDDDPFKGSEKDDKLPMIAMIIGSITLFLISIGLYISCSTAYVTVPLLPRNVPCTILVHPNTNYSDLGENIDLPGFIDEGVEMAKRAALNYNQLLVLWNFIYSFSVVYSLALLLILVAMGNKVLIIVRKFIIYIGVVGAIVFISLEVAVTFLAFLIFQSGDLSSYEINSYEDKEPDGQVYEIQKNYLSILKLAFKINNIPRISFCPLVSPIYNYWAQELLIVAPVLMFITFAMIAVLVYLKLSPFLIDVVNQPQNHSTDINSNPDTIIELEVFDSYMKP